MRKLQTYSYLFLLFLTIPAIGGDGHWLDQILSTTPCESLSCEHTPSPPSQRNSQFHLVSGLVVGGCPIGRLVNSLNINVSGWSPESTDNIHITSDFGVDEQSPLGRLNIGDILSYRIAGPGNLITLLKGRFVRTALFVPVTDLQDIDNQCPELPAAGYLKIVFSHRVHFFPGEHVGGGRYQGGIVVFGPVNLFRDPMKVPEADWPDYAGNEEHAVISFNL